mmetsp:Transcript_27066/g.76315  ORF Transcript_27066/g.76315 Transcript_27066/m.76315 type:complete len:757 (+) Transcript_27066:155-2425(+)|eukprot:CAMPEP_0117680868 /NCGR_PEP_ID=MMETSP0804-20121206/18614_1 /TAXON_ID=1074897 /ORGANISM="Tetraselmis astigmatica, Strain CCMP880" /LENGTH=756 /DNA_ID=CAMNT_0005490459 /DNA_START=76 /DNA_END=2346 /DNA_ORIENTATION=+
MDFAAQEAVDGVRFTWNCWPMTKTEGARLGQLVPLSMMVTPLKRSESITTVPYEPVRCKSCTGVLNPYCTVDYATKLWICPFCMGRNHFPAHYAQISENNLPAELFQSYTAIEYCLPNRMMAPPAFMLLCDLALPEEEIRHMKDALRQVVSMLPDNALVGIITFGAHVNVHELGYQQCAKQYCFRGSKVPNPEEVRVWLGLQPLGQRPRNISAPGGGRFLLPLADCEFALEQLLEDMEPWPEEPPRGHRAKRATGAAVGVATCLMEACIPNGAARIMVFTGGPCTVGPGMTVGTNLEEMLRTHQDLEKGACPYYQDSCKYYEGLALQMVSNSFCLDVFACALDQVGLAEMRPAVVHTGGLILLSETFEGDVTRQQDVFRKSLQRMFRQDANGHLDMSFGAQMEVMCSRENKVCGAIGPVASLGRQSPCVSELEMGIGNTSAWKLNVLDHNTTVAFFFEVANNQNANPLQPGRAFFMQYITTYFHSSGQQRMRVATVGRTWCDPAGQELAMGFDQECATVVLSRLATFKAESDDAFDVLRWLDRTLIRISNRFGDYQKDVPETFQLNQSFSLLPQFMFHLRRSQFLQVFNNTPDETAYFRHLLMKQDTAGSLVMIQPTLLAYSFNGPPEPVLLDVESIQPDRILLLDSFFMVVVHYGSTIAQWRKAGYQDQEEHENFRQLLAAPLADAEELLKDRLPVPRWLKCDQYGSQARFLLAKLNPSATHNSGFGAGDVIFTDDVSLNVFMEHLAKLAVVSGG